MRPNLTEEEVKFLLSLLLDIEGKNKRQFLNLEEEQAHLEIKLFELKRIRVYEGFVATHHRIKTREKRLALVSQWLPIVNWRLDMLDNLIIRLEKLQRPERRGRMPMFRRAQS